MKKTLLLTVLLFFSVICNAQLLWKISGNGLEKPSYILGTMHTAPVSICDNIDGFDEAFSSCTQFYGEMNMSSLKDPEEMQKLMAAMMLPQDTLLSDLFTPEEYKILDSTIKKHIGFSVDMLKNMKPMALSAQLAMMIGVKQLKLSPADMGQLVDDALQVKAAENNMSVYGFETLDQQSKILFNTPLKEQAEALMLSIEMGLEEVSQKMIDAYYDHDIKELYKQFDDAGMNEEEKAIMLDNRNIDWVEQLSEILPKAPTFIAVGAGHLPGKNGVIELLKDKGYKVKPVK